jgi:hypothetical protein
VITLAYTYRNVILLLDRISSDCEKVSAIFQHLPDCFKSDLPRVELVWVKLNALTKCSYGETQLLLLGDLISAVYRLSNIRKLPHPLSRDESTFHKRIKFDSNEILFSRASANHSKTETTSKEPAQGFGQGYRTLTLGNISIDSAILNGEIFATGPFEY